MAARLLLIRHAHVDAGSRLCGWLDVPLSASGCAQLRALTRRTAARAAPDALYTSTLARARQVSDVLGRMWNLDPRALAAVREIHCGALEGLRLDDLRRRYADLWARNDAQVDDDFEWPGGESYRAFRARVFAGLETAAAAHEGGRVAIVTHAGVISQVLGAIRGRPAAVWSAERPGPLTATEVTWSNGSPRAVLTYADPDWY